MGNIKTMDDLELRMYGIVPYNLSPIQQGIQFGHAVVEYGQRMKRLDENKQSLTKQYDQWANKWKTFIVLNGGTTSNKINLNDGLPYGTLNKHLLTLANANIEFSFFHEPDLGDQLTAIVFIVDERVFNKKKYPDFSDWVIINYGGLVRTVNDIDFETFKNSNNYEDRKVCQEWIDFVGGEKNVFLRNFLKDFKLA
jgi:hypothetical protein